jgi:8-oxo-dGTP pyrophosphatase MutT (NUDIX family)
MDRPLKDALILHLQAGLAQEGRCRPAGNGLKPAAVLAPLFHDGHEWRVLFTKRTDRVEAHKGQVSFPGGTQDPQDETLLATALRETFEEIGVRAQDVEVVGGLEPVVTITNYLVCPFVGLIPHPYPFRLNDYEVERLIEVPLSQLLAEDRDQPADNPAALQFNRQGDLIWGATARILHQLLGAVRS